jgi:hypothetical protein
VGLLITTLIDRVTNVSGLRNGFFLLGVFLGLSGALVLGAKVAVVVLRRRLRQRHA